MLTTPHKKLITTVMAVLFVFWSGGFSLTAGERGFLARAVEAITPESVLATPTPTETSLPVTPTVTTVTSLTVTAAPLLTPETPELSATIAATLPVTFPAVITPTLPVTPADLSSSQPPSLPAPASAPAAVLISECLYAGLTSSTEGDEFVELCNSNTTTVDLTGYKVGDAATRGDGESMYRFPPGVTLPPDGCLVVAKNANQFLARFDFLPDFEVVTAGNGYSDNGAAPNLIKYAAWAGGSWSLSNTGDEIVLLGPADEVVDSVAYGSSDYAVLGLEPGVAAPAPNSLQRVWPIDTDSMAHDFVRALPSPALLTLPPPAPAVAVPPAILPDGMKAFWGHLHAHTSYSDGAGPPAYALAMARAAGLHFYALTDDGSLLSPAEWADTLAQVQSTTVPAEFVALRGVEWDHPSAGHINVFNSDTLLNCNDPLFDTLPKLYGWLVAHTEAIAQFNHPCPDAGGDFNNFTFDSGAAARLFTQEIYNAARPASYELAFVQSNGHGWRMAPVANGDTREANWGIDTTARTGLVAPALTEADLLDALRARRVFATEDSNLALALRLGGAWMGSVLPAADHLPLVVDLVDPDPEPLTLVLYDDNLPLVSVSLPLSTGQWTTTVTARPGHAFWVKVIQADGQTAYSAPVWIAGPAPPETVYLNEILPAPRNFDWDGNGVVDAEDEWLELFNPAGNPVGLGGWQLADAAGRTHTIPLDQVLPGRGFVTFYRAQTGLALNNSEETLRLTRLDGSQADQYFYGQSPGYDESWCRLPDGGAHWSGDCGPSPNAANWEKVPPGPLSVSIYDAKRLTPGAQVRVKGRVTAPPGILGARNMYIQDETAGILIYLPENHGHFFNLGDRVEVVGKLRLFHQEFELAVKDRGDVEFMEAGLPPPPLPVATTSLLEPYEGRLVLLQGRAVDFEGYTTIWLDDGTGPAKTYIRQSTGIKKPFISPGAPVTAIGIVSQYSDSDEASRYDYRLLLRYQTDLIVPAPTSLPADWPTVLPETGG